MRILDIERVRNVLSDRIVSSMRTFWSEQEPPYAIEGNITMTRYLKDGVYKLFTEHVCTECGVDCDDVRPVPFTAFRCVNCCMNQVAIYSFWDDESGRAVSASEAMSWKGDEGFFFSDEDVAIFRGTESPVAETREE